MIKRHRVLIIGGYGTFGGRLAQLLADEPRLELIIAGRSLAKATLFCSKLAAQAVVIPAVFDREADLNAQLVSIAPELIVDATGPFQNYGSDPYGLIRASIRQGAHYIDLADGSDFVKGVSQLNQLARDQELFILSGVSSFPVLTAAVVRQLAEPMHHVVSITGGIAPSPYAGVGINVIRAIASYAGKPVKLTRNGLQATGFALSESMRYTIAPPGQIPLRNIRFSLVDVPDLQLIPEQWPGLSAIWIGAGPVPEILHRALNGLAWLVRLKLLPSLAPFATILYHAINILRWGEHRGGMFVKVSGMDANGGNITRSWHLLAEGDHGPLIPSMAAEALIRKWCAGETITSGARPATNDLAITDYEQLFAKRMIMTGIRDSVQEGDPLYRQILGSAWDMLPPVIQQMHGFQTVHAGEGAAEVIRGKNRLAAWIADYFGFPAVGHNIPVRVEFCLRDGREVWQRDFAGSRFTSLQWAGSGRDDKLLCERFGPFTFSLAVVIKNQQLHLIIRRWKVWNIPLPLCLAPGGESYEYEKDGRFHFHIHISLPLIGLLVQYRGWLKPVTT